MPTRILGIDPGSRRTGIGLITVSRGQLKHLHHGFVQTSDEDFPLRLKDIFDGVSAVIAEFRPDEAAVTLGTGEEREVERIPEQLRQFL